MNWTSAGSGCSLPSIATIKRIRQGVLKNLFVPRSVSMLHVDRSKAGARTGVGLYASATEAPVMVVKPSDWAKLDLRTCTIHDLILQGSKASNSPSIPLFRSIEDVPLVRNRELHLGLFRLPHVYGPLVSVRTGTSLSITLYSRDSSERDLLREHFKCFTSGQCTIRGEVVRHFVFDRTDEVGSSDVPSALFKAGDAILKVRLVQSAHNGSTGLVFLVYRTLRTPGAGD